MGMVVRNKQWDFPPKFLGKFLGEVELMDRVSGGLTRISYVKMHKIRLDS